MIEGAKKITTKEAACILGVTDSRVRHMILKGSIQAEKFGRDLFILRKDIESLLKNRTKGHKQKTNSILKTNSSRQRKKTHSLKPLDEIIAESGVGVWTDKDFEKAGQFSDLFVGFDEWLTNMRKENMRLERKRWQGLGL